MFKKILKRKEGIMCAEGKCGCKGKCKHPSEKVYSMLVSRTLNHPKKEDDFWFPVNESLNFYWRDFFVGLGCTDCGEQMVLPFSKRIALGDIYRGKPHYAVEEESEHAAARGWFPGDNCD